MADTTDAQRGAIIRERYAQMKQQLGERRDREDEGRSDVPEAELDAPDVDGSETSAPELDVEAPEAETPEHEQPEVSPEAVDASDAGSSASDTPTGTPDEETQQISEQSDNASQVIASQGSGEAITPPTAVATPRGSDEAEKTNTPPVSSVATTTLGPPPIEGSRPDASTVDADKAAGTVGATSSVAPAEFDSANASGADGGGTVIVAPDASTSSDGDVVPAHEDASGADPVSPAQPPVAPSIPPTLGPPPVAARRRDQELEADDVGEGGQIEERDDDAAELAATNESRRTVLIPPGPPAHETSDGRSEASVDGSGGTTARETPPHGEATEEDEAGSDREPVGTVLISPGHTRRPDSERETEDEEIAADEDGTPESAGHEEEPTEAVDDTGAETDETDHETELGHSSSAGTAGAVSLPPVISLDPRASIPMEVIAAAKRREELERRKRRLRLGFLFGGLAAAVVLTAVIILVVLNQRSGLSDEFHTTHAAAVAVVEDKVHAPLIEAIGALDGQEKPDIAAVATRAAKADSEVVGSLALPSAEGRYAEKATRLAAAVEAESTFLLMVAELKDRDPTEFDETLANKVRTTWVDVINSFVAVYADNDRLDAPKWDEFEQHGEAFAAAIERRGERARRLAAERSELDAYYDAAVAVLQGYDRARADIDSYNGSSQRPSTYTEQSAFSNRFNSASSTFDGLAGQLASLSPPNALSGPHSGLVVMLRGWVNATESAASAAYEVECETYSYGYYYDTCIEMGAVGDTSTYEAYLRTRSRLIAEADRLRAELNSAHESKLQRLSDG